MIRTCGLGRAFIFVWLSWTFLASATPAAQRGTSGDCRNYAASFTATVPSGIVVIQATCEFDAPTKVMLCSITNHDTRRNCDMTSKTRHIYHSIADFVDEAKFVGRQWFIENTAVVTSACPGHSGGTSTNANMFDAQHRLVSTTFKGSSGTPTLTTNVAWDAQGRPTESTIKAGGTATRVTYSYNDAAGSYTQTPAVGLPAVFVFDANANPVRVTGIDGSLTQVFSKVTTKRACK